MQPLAIQAYLRSGGTLQELETEYFIRFLVAPNGLVALNYHQYLTPMDVPHCRECRALYLEPGSWDVASRAFGKFFNYGEPGCAEIDWDSAQVMEKLDGSLVCFYHYRGRWHAGTRGHPQALGPVQGPDGTPTGLTFADLIRQAIEEIGSTWEAFTGALDPGFFYSFELTAPENQVLVRYERRELTLLAAWDRATLQEVEIEELAEVPAPRISRRALATLEELTASLAELDPSEREGVVVRDRHFARVKIKAPRYAMAARAMNQMTTEKARLEFLLTGNLDDVFPYLPAYQRQAFERLRGELDALMRETLATYESLRDLPDQKTFALAAQTHRWSSALFQLRKGESYEQVLGRARLEHLCRVLGLRDGA